MALRSAAAPRLLSPLRHLARSLNSSTTNSSSAAGVSPYLFSDKAETSAILRPAETSVLDLNDVEKLFASVPTGKLVRSTANMHAVAVNPLVDVGMWMMNSRLMKTYLVRDALLATVKNTFYEQFCAGENEVEVARTMESLHEAGLRGMMVYALEDCSGENACDQNLDHFLKTVDLAQMFPPSSVSFTVVKLTAIVPIEVLARVSDLLRWQKRHPSFRLPWKQDTLPLFSDSTPLYHTLQQPPPLTPEEELTLHQGHQRLLKLCQRCQVAGIPLTVDAEYTSIQPAIDYLTFSSAIASSKDGRPLVYGTMQAYLKDAKDRLGLAMDAAEKRGVPLGFKLVRGAYMSSEARVANSLGYDTPVHNTIQDTHACYNDCAGLMLERIDRGTGGVILATHNVDSGKLVASQARDLGIGKGNEMLEFAQLYGMSDGLSFGLRNAGFQVSKYMPYGPVEKVIPYLLRRAEENRGLLATGTVERQLMRKEIGRRLKAFFVN